LQNLIDNQHRLSGKAFIAFADELKGVSLSSAKKQAAEVF
jgi:hypothetical protein